MLIMIWIVRNACAVLLHTTQMIKWCKDHFSFHSLEALPLYLLLFYYKISWKANFAPVGKVAHGKVFSVVNSEKSIQVILFKHNLADSLPL